MKYNNISLNMLKCVCTSAINNTYAMPIMTFLNAAFFNFQCNNFQENVYTIIIWFPLLVHTYNLLYFNILHKKYPIVFTIFT